MAAKKVKAIKRPVNKAVVEEVVSPEPPRFSPKKQALRELMSEFNEPDHKVIAFAEDVPNTYTLRRPSGIMQLDIDTGGGLPAGGLSCLTGPDGVGKNFLLNKYMAMHQRLYGDESCIGFAPLEGAFDFNQAIRCGMKVNVPDEMIEQWNQARVERGLPRYNKEEHKYFKQQVGEFVLLRGSTGEEVMDAMLECVGSKLFGIICLDSVNALLPAADASKDLDEGPRMAARATLMTRFFNLYNSHTSGLNGSNNTTLIFTQQVRANSAKASAPSHLQRYLSDHKESGAYATKHFKLIDIHVSNGSKLKKKIDGEDTVIGKELKWSLAKGKAGTHDNINGMTKFLYETGTDDLDTIIMVGLSAGVIVERKGKIHLIKPETGEIGDIKDIPNATQLRKMMEVDFEFELAVRREILAAKGIQCLYR